MNNIVQNIQTINPSEVQATPKVNPYIITDSLSKAIFIDGLSTATFLLIPLVTIPFTIVYAPEILMTPALNAIEAVFPVVESVSQFSFIVAINIAGAFSTYTIRDLTREPLKDAGFQHYNGILGGGIKYGGRELVSQYYNNPADKFDFAKLFTKTALGAGNNFMYEQCNADEICKNSNLFVLEVEAGESAIEASGMGFYNLAIKQGEVNLMSSVFSSAIGGAIAGGLVVLYAENVYGPIKNYTHDLSDEFYAYYNSTLSGVLETVGI